MVDQHYIREVMAAEHTKDLGREMESERQLALLPQEVSGWRRGIGRCGQLLVKVGSRLEKTAQTDAQVPING